MSTPDPEVDDSRATDEPRARTLQGKRVRWLVAGLVVAVGLAWGVVAMVAPQPAGPGKEPAPSTPHIVVGPGSGSEVAGSQPAPGVPPEPDAVAPKPAGDASLLADVRKDQRVTLDDANAVGLAHQACVALQGGSTRGTVEAAVASAGPSSHEAAASLVEAAIANVCPEIREHPPSTVMRDGLFRVGVDVQPGRYVATGGAQCSWARSTVPDTDLPDIIESGKGPKATVTLVGGQYFISSQCEGWAKG